MKIASNLMVFECATKNPGNANTKGRVFKILELIKGTGRKNNKGVTHKNHFVGTLQFSLISFFPLFYNKVIKREKSLFKLQQTIFWLNFKKMIKLHLNVCFAAACACIAMLYMVASCIIKTSNFFM